MPFYRDAFRVVVLGHSPDAVAAKNGWRFRGLFLGRAIYILGPLQLEVTGVWVGPAMATSDTAAEASPK
jgi:hypothetical protein